MSKNLNNEIYSIFYKAMYEILEKLLANESTIEEVYNHLNDTNEELAEFFYEKYQARHLFAEELAIPTFSDIDNIDPFYYLEILTNELNNKDYSDFKKILREKSFEQTLAEKNRKTYDKILDTYFSDKIPFLNTCENSKLITKMFDTNIFEYPHIPFTKAQKGFLKNMIMDNKACLFMDDDDLKKMQDLLQNVEPLYNPESIVVFDKYKNTDDFENPNYKKKFRQLLNHSVGRSNPNIKNQNSDSEKWTTPGDSIDFEYICDLEKFYFKFYNDSDNEYSIPLDEIKDIYQPKFNPVEFLENYDDDKVEWFSKMFTFNKQNEVYTTNSVTFEIKNHNSILDHILSVFSYLKKDCKKIDENTFQLTVNFEDDDIEEIINKMLSFGPDIKVIEAPFQYEIEIDENEPLEEQFITLENQINEKYNNTFKSRFIKQTKKTERPIDVMKS